MKNVSLRIALTTVIVMSTMLVYAGGTLSLIEINPLHGHSSLTLTSDSAKTYYGAGEITAFTEMNGKLYFSAQGSPGDDELWVTDGTPVGTSMVKAINPGTGAALGNMVKVGNYILFMATDNGSTWDLWSTDGTASGTVKIAVLAQPSNTALGPYNVSTMGSRLLFCTNDHLVISDGTAAGTSFLLSISSYSRGFGYCDYSGSSYFILPEVSGGDDIWRSDGTTQGTQTMLELDTTSFNITSVGTMVSSNGKIYLSAAPNGQMSSLFTYDGSLNGQLKHIATPSDSLLAPHDFCSYDSSLYFIANSGGIANIYRVSASDSLPVPLIASSPFDTISNLSFADSSVYFMATDNKHINAVNLSSLVYTQLDLQGYSLPDFQNTNSPFLIGVNGKIFFEAYDSTTGNQVFVQSDFTPAGTVITMPPNANTSHPFDSKIGSGIEDVFDLKTWGSKILLPANFTDAGRELWIYDESIAAGINTIKEDELFTIYPNPAYSEVTIKTSQGSGGEQQISIINIYGQIMWQQDIQTEVTTIKLSLLAAGAYYLKLSGKGNTIGVEKLVVVK